MKEEHFLHKLIEVTNVTDLSAKWIVITLITQ
jgi:hypothetical protein